MDKTIEQRLSDMYPDLLKNQFAKLCFEVFLKTDKGKLLMAHLFEMFVNKPFSQPLDHLPKYDPQVVVNQAIRKDFIQSLLGVAQQYESELRKKGESIDELEME